MTEPRSTDVRVAGNGRMVLPRYVRDALGLKGETKVILTLEGDEVRLTPVRHGVRRAQELYRKHATAHRATDDFLRDRMEEAAADGSVSSVDELKPQPAGKARPR